MTVHTAWARDGSGVVQPHPGPFFFVASPPPRAFGRLWVPPGASGTRGNLGRPRGGRRPRP
eukprot:2380750-Pyramimonas_sp.AAC.1